MTAAAMNRSCALAWVLAVGGCAPRHPMPSQVGAPPPAPVQAATASADAAQAAAQGDAAKTPRVSCWLERPTGSNIMRRVCWRQDDLDEARRRAEDYLRTPPVQGDALAPRNGGATPSGAR